MITLNLSEADALTIVNGLRVAAERFDTDAGIVDSANLHAAAKKSLIKQFEQQAADSRRIATVVEDAANG